MSRINYDCDDENFPNQSQLYWQAQQNALRGKRGQALLRELEQALVALPAPRLIEGDFCAEGEVCALGAVALRRELEAGADFQAAVAKLEDESSGHASWEGVSFAAERLGLPAALASAVVQENDIDSPITPEQRYRRVLDWVRRQLAEAGQ
jgi:hypothetical protein